MKMIKMIQLIFAIGIYLLTGCTPHTSTATSDSSFINNITSAQIVELNFTWDKTSPLLGMNPPYALTLKDTHKATNGMIPDLSFAADTMTFSGQHGAPTIDALGHIGHKGNLYGGVKAIENEDSDGLKSLGIDEYPSQRLVNRGILLDVARYKGVNSLSPGEEITAKDLKETAKSQNVKIKAGDSVLIRTGYGQYFENNKSKYMGFRPGPGESAALWLADQNVFLTGDDQLTYEVYPEQGTVFPVHRTLLADNGIYIVENMNLEELSTVLAKRGTYEFLLVLNPPRIRGATGMPINAFAIIPNDTGTIKTHRERTKAMKLLQMDFTFQGMSKEEMNQNIQDLARDIANHPGVIWKIWTVNEKTHEGGGIYLFEDETTLKDYVQMHRERLKGFGVDSINSKMFDIPEVLTKITRGQLSRTENTSSNSIMDTDSMRLLQMDFPFQGMSKEDMDQNIQDLARNIAEHPGVIWKIWTVNEKTHEGGGIYLFEDEATLKDYVQIHKERLKSFGVTKVSTKIFEIPEVLTKITHGPIPQ